MTIPATTARQRQAIFRFVAAMAVGNLLWEFAHVRLYTLWLTGDRGEIVYAVLHCTVGDMIIAALALAVSLALFGRKGWPERAIWPVAVTTIGFALAYTVFSEWLNTAVRQSWTYRPQMPLLPPLGTGLTPILQWIVVPAVAFVWIGSGLRPHRGHT